jgi:hypothetical protein
MCCNSFFTYNLCSGKLQVDKCVDYFLPWVAPTAPIELDLLTRSKEMLSHAGKVLIISQIVMHLVL